MTNAMFFPDTVEEYMEYYKVTDSDHVYSNGVDFVPIFRMSQWFDHLKPEIKTNEDRIRAMSVEELAEWISNQIIDRNIGVSAKSWLDWLKQECE